MDTFKASPLLINLEIISDPYVVHTPFGYQPYINVKNLDNNKEGKIIISPISLSKKIRELFEENNFLFIGIKFSYKKESIDPKSKYIIEKIK